MQSCAILACPWTEPAGVLSAIAEEPYAVGLLSGGEGPRARWSYVARAPSSVVRLDPRDGADPLATLSALIGPLAPGDPSRPPFQGGLIGLACYELAARFEPLDLGRMPGWPDL